jgi:hypothetical protein
VVRVCTGALAPAFKHQFQQLSLIDTTQIQITIGLVGTFQGMLVDVILLVRLITVHPLSHIGLVRFTLLTSLPIALKVARTVNIILYINQLSIVANGPHAFQEVNSAWLTLPYLKIEWIAQVVDNRSIPHYLTPPYEF